MIVLTRTLNLIQIWKITMHANSPCKNALKYSTNILADNDSRDSSMHKDPDRWSNNSLFLSCHRPIAP